MRCLFSKVVTATLLASILGFADTALATNNTAWFRGEIQASSIQHSASNGRGNCLNGTVTAYDYSRNDYIPNGRVCAVGAQWGAVITESDYIRVGPSYLSYHEIDLPDGVSVLAVPQSDRLFVGHVKSNGNMEVGYVSSPLANLTFNDITRRYQRQQSITYLPQEFVRVGFSNNGDYMIGVTPSGQLSRVSLGNFSVSTVTVPGLAAVAPSMLVKLTISDDGTLVAGYDGSGYVAIYDFGGCLKGVDGCDSRLLNTVPLQPWPALSHIYLDEDSIVMLYTYAEINTNVTRFDFSLVNETRRVSYVALGDSFSSGEGTWDYAWGTDGEDEYPSEKCHQGHGSYPALYNREYFGGYAERGTSQSGTGMRIQQFVTAACSGAKMEHVWLSSVSLQEEYLGQFRQFEKFRDSDVRQLLRQDAVANQTPGRALQRDFLAYYQPDIATVGIGGNDIGFEGILAACAGSFGTCPQAFIKRAESGRAIQQQFNKLVETFQDLHDASPATRLYAVGYPLFVADDSLLCGLNTSLNQTERRFIRESIRYLNDVIEAAAKKVGIGYIDIENALSKSVLCGSGRSGVNGLSAGNDVYVPGTQLQWIAQESFHPNAYGYERIAEKIIADYGELDTYPNYNCPQVASGYCPNGNVSAPLIPVYFNASSATGVAGTQSMTDSSLFDRLMDLLLTGLRPTSIVRGTLFSEPHSLGTFRADENGVLNQTVELPADLEPGYHTIYFSGTLANGEPFEYWQTILYLPPDTKTGPCGFLPYSNIDQDGDGIDDACDPLIDVAEPIRVVDPDTVLIYPNQPQSSMDESGQPAELGGTASAGDQPATASNTSTEVFEQANSTTIAEDGENNQIPEVTSELTPPSVWPMVITASIAGGVCVAAAIVLFGRRAS